jgi:hypothetical protein
VLHCLLRSDILARNKSFEATMQPFAGHHDQNEIPGLVALILNGSPDTRLPYHAGTWCLEDPKEIKSGRGEAMRVAKQSFRHALRKRVDQWIDSGRDFKADSEARIEPKKRSLFKRSPSSFALEYSLTPWLKRNPPKIGMLSGYVGIPGGLPDQPPIFLQFNPPGLDESLPPVHGGCLWGNELANYWLFRLVSSPRQRCFARCSNEACKQYFVYKRTPVPRYNTYCPLCKGAGTKRRVESARDLQYKRKIDAAAKVWSKWKPAFGNRFVWVASEANKSLSNRDFMQRQFVSRNKEEIESAGMGGKNAKG